MAWTSSVASGPALARADLDTVDLPHMSIANVRSIEALRAVITLERRLFGMLCANMLHDIVWASEHSGATGPCARVSIR